MIRLGVAFLLAASPALHAQEAEIQRALIQRDQQSAEFAAAIRGGPAGPLQSLNARQLGDVLAIPLPAELRPYQRATMAAERELAFSPPRVRAPEPQRPLPLPGGLPRGVDPVTPQGFPY